MEPDLAAEAGRRSGPTPIQVIAAGLLLVAVGVAVWAVQERPQLTVAEVELLAGTVLGPADLALMEAVFDRADLSGHRVEAGRLFVSRGRRSSYLRALVDAGALPPEFGGSLRRAVENDSPWRSQASQADRLRIATQEELSLVIRTMPGIEQAAVLYDLKAGGQLFPDRGERIQTASVSVRTEPGATLDAHRVQAIRVLVASSIAGLRAERVAVTDLRSGRVYDGPLVSDAELIASDPDRARAVAYERHVTAKIRQALSFMPNAVVEVNASSCLPALTEPDTRPAAHQLPRAAANAPATVSVTKAPANRGAVPKRVVQVSIAIPEGYLLKVRERRPGASQAAGDAASTELDRLERLVAGLVPISPPWDHARVTITRFPGQLAAAMLPVEPLQPAVPEVARPAAVTAGREAAAAPQPPASAEPIDRMLAGLPLSGERSIVLAVSLGLAVLGGLALLLGGSKRQLPQPLPGGPRDAIDWSTLRRPGSFDTHREAA
jgi:hypothetical protein